MTLVDNPVEGFHDLVRHVGHRLRSKVGGVWDRDCSMFLIGGSEHVGHRLKCVRYGPAERTFNVALECETCFIVLMDFDHPELEYEVEAGAVA